MQAVVIENKAKINKPLAKPTDFTTGPKAHTPTELKPKEMPSLMPATRERKRSSTYLEIKTSVKGTAPKIKTINSKSENSNHQPCAMDAKIKTGIWAATINKKNGFKGNFEIK